MKLNKKIDFTTKINADALAVLTHGGYADMLNTLEDMYRNIFVYQMPGADDYNLLTFADRLAINELQTLLSSFLKIVQKYDARHWLIEPMMSEADAAEIDELYSGLSFERAEYVKMLDLMMITTVLYKNVQQATVPTEETVTTHFWCSMMKQLFTGHEGFNSCPAKQRKAA